MYKNFTDYWNQKKAILEKLGVTEDAGRMIWEDALNVVLLEALDLLVKGNKK